MKTPEERQALNALSQYPHGEDRPEKADFEAKFFLNHPGALSSRRISPLITTLFSDSQLLDNEIPKHFNAALREADVETIDLISAYPPFRRTLSAPYRKLDDALTIFSNTENLRAIQGRVALPASLVDQLITSFTDTESKELAIDALRLDTISHYSWESAYSNGEQERWTFNDSGIDAVLRSSLEIDSLSEGKSQLFSRLLGAWLKKQDESTAQCTFQSLMSARMSLYQVKDPLAGAKLIVFNQAFNAHREALENLLSLREQTNEILSTYRLLGDPLESAPGRSSFPIIIAREMFDAGHREWAKHVLVHTAPSRNNADLFNQVASEAGVFSEPLLQEMLTHQVLCLFPGPKDDKYLTCVFELLFNHAVGIDMSRVLIQQAPKIINLSNELAKYYIESGIPAKKAWVSQQFTQLFDYASEETTSKVIAGIEGQWPLNLARRHPRMLRENLAQDLDL